MYDVSTANTDDVLFRHVLHELYCSIEWNVAGRSALPLWDDSCIGVYPHLHLFVVCQAGVEECEETAPEARVSLGSWCRFHDIPLRRCYSDESISPHPNTRNFLPTRSPPEAFRWMRT